MGKNTIYTLEIRYVIKCSAEHLSDTMPAVLGPRFWDFAQQSKEQSCQKAKSQHKAKRT